MRVRFVTTNAGKYREVAAILERSGVGLEHVDRTYPEVQADSVAEVVASAAASLASEVEPPWMIDDSGFLVASLGGFPGVYSSYVFRTIGVRGVLRLLGESRSRAARFETALLFHDGTAARRFHGTCTGRVSREARGSGGFGFDPIFIPDGFRKTFGEMSVDEKNRISHRARAVGALARHLARRPRTAVHGGRVE